MKFTRLFIALLCVITTVLFSCNKSVIDATRVALKEPDVYVSGFYFQAKEARAVYWKNGVEKVLASGPFISTHAYGIAVSDTTVYVVGEFNGKAVYWKNGVQIALDRVLQGEGFSVARAISINGNDVYIAGTQFVGNGLELVYWKNGVKTIVPSPELTDVTGIAVSGSDVYITGSAEHSAVCWKNGMKQDLSSRYARATGIAVSGTDVYVSGEEGTGQPVYWKNGIKTVLQPLFEGVANGISVSGSDVYVTGMQSGKIAFWKNNVKTEIDNNFSVGRAVAVNRNDIYVAGEIRNSSYNTAAIWKNGIKTEMGAVVNPAASEQVIASAITLVNH